MPPASRRARDADVLSTDTPMQVQIYRQLRSEIVDGLEAAKISFLNLVQRVKAEATPAR